MAISYRVESENELVTLRLIGEVTMHDYEESARQLLSDPLVKPGYALLYLGHELARLPSVIELPELSRLAKQLLEAGLTPIALVAASPSQYAVGSMFASVAQLAGVPVGVFNSPVDALAWIRRGRTGAPTPGAGTPRII